MQEGKILVIFLVCDLFIPNNASNSHIKDLSIEKKIKGKINNKNTDIITHDLNYMESAMFINFSFWLRYWGPLQILESGATTKIFKKKKKGSSYDETFKLLKPEVNTQSLSEALCWYSFSKAAVAKDCKSGLQVDNSFKEAGWYSGIGLNDPVEL